VLGRLGHPDPAQLIMIGDRSHDVVGAREHGIECIGVRWGYGTPGELEGARPLQICTTTDEVAKLLGVDVNARAL
jgi:phosphoglycolate phosphatase